jgi:hypothetical protein
MQSIFDPKAFLDVQITEQGSVISVPIPIGEKLAVVEKVDTRVWQSKDGQKSGLALDVTWLIDDVDTKRALGREKVTITQGIMVDLTDSNALDMGKGRNVVLNRTRDAVGLNEPGRPFSFRMLEGKVAKIVIGHRPSERPQDPPGTVFSDVIGVVKAA